MDATPNKDSDRRLLDAIQAFVARHPHPSLRGFQESLAHWGETWRGVAPRHLPAADLLAQAMPSAIAGTRELVALFDRENAHRKWEQSYTKADGLVGDDMLSGYGFAEVIGQQGPFLSKRVRSGLGVWGPDIDYPPHRHRAEEVYLLLAGGAEFRLGRGAAASARSCAAGDVVHVPSLQTHGFRTKREPLVVLFIWQAGDLREKSDFSREPATADSGTTARAPRGL